MILWVIFDGADEGSLLSWGQILIVGDFLEVTANVRAKFTTDVNTGLRKEIEGYKEMYIPLALVPASS